MAYIEYINDSVRQKAEALASELDHLDALVADGQEVPSRYQPAPDSPEARTAEQEASAWARAALSSATKKEIKKMREWAKTHPPYGQFSDLAQDMNSRLPQQSRVHVRSSYPQLWCAIAAEFKGEHDSFVKGVRDGSIYY